ncbi:hypothetical protein [Nocardioides mangrovi]|uniref:Uncharacterized protein n=1 Tax=Nocardioides mangrovi TaxID=2874580 RepID=A0ABS7UJW3_9ACTN|nr:hypothetical protein [Nocardioides mangrovi]MBZ5741324.1 hypothetical protein [Nocardioides mangrovi]
MMLRDQLEDAVADVAADLATLTTASRRQGLGIRRRRRALAAVGAVAAVTVLAVTGYALRPGTPEIHVSDGPPSTGTEADLSGESAPITAAGTAAALQDAVASVAHGTFGRFQGDVSGGEALAALLFTPLGSNGPAGQVMVNLQPLLRSVGGPPYTCESFMTDCSVRELPDGDTLRTYHDDGDSEFGAASKRLVAEVLSPDRHLRVVVFALNTNPWAGGEYQTEPVLALHGLSEIARQPWWSTTELPEEYVEAGRDLDLYPG